MEIRIKRYPPLPPKGGPRLSIVLPTKGDLRLRPLLPDTFLNQFAIHCDADHGHVYAKFLVVRTFIVMSIDGDLYTQTLRTELHTSELPGGALLPLPPPLAQGDITKVLDLVQCYTFESATSTRLRPNIRWELVRVRWRNAYESWIPIELMSSQPPNLLQEFYVASVNSWSFRDRIFPQSLTLYRTEVELWLHQPEFQKFYRQLRRRKALLDASTQQEPPQAQVQPPSQAEPQTQPQTQPQAQPQAQPQTQSRQGKSPTTSVPTPAPNAWTSDVSGVVPIAKKSRPNATPPIHISSRPPPPPARPLSSASSTGKSARREPTQPSSVSSSPIPATHRPSKKSQPSTETDQSKRLETRSGSSSKSKSKGKSEEKSKSKSKSNSRSNAESEDSSLHSRVPKRRRLKRSLVVSDDEDEEILSVLTKRKGSETVTGHPVPPTSAASDSANDGTGSESGREDRRRRGGQPNHESSSKPPPSSVSRVNAPVLVIDDDSSHSNSSSESRQRRRKRSANRTSEIEGEDGDVTTDEDEDYRHLGDMAQTGVLPIQLDGVRCVCGATNVGRYTGEWLRCWQEDCGAWEHAECVGVLNAMDNDVVNDYRCSTCDQTSYKSRYEKATRHLMLWMFLCCESRNQRQLLKLLREVVPTSTIGDYSDKWQPNQAAGSSGESLLVRSARNGLLRTTTTLIKRYHANVFALDSHSRNVLHHAAKGLSPTTTGVVTFLLTHFPTLMTHGDLAGQTPLHLMLRSPRLNRLCIPILKSDPALLTTGDFGGNMPIHYACQAVNESTVEICRRILRAQPLAVREKAPRGLRPLMLLCQASPSQFGEQAETRKATFIAEIIEMMLDVDVLGGFLNERDERGWTALHYAAQAANPVLLHVLLQQRGLNSNAVTYDGGDTALHLAAQSSHTNRVSAAASIRTLLAEGANVLALDAAGWIPILRVVDSACLREFLHVDLWSQLVYLSELAQKYNYREAIRSWQLSVVRDPTCFDIVNDVLQSHVHEIEMIEELMLLTRPFVRIDHKLEYFSRVVVPSLVRLPQTASDTNSEGTGCPDIVLTTSGGCYWKQFVAQTRDLPPVLFRSQIRLVLARGDHSRIDNRTLVLVRLTSGLLQADTGLLVRRDRDGTVEPATEEVMRARAATENSAMSPPGCSVDSETLVEFCVLGELVAHFVLMEVPLTDVIEFSSGFLRCILDDYENSSPLGAIGEGTCDPRLTCVRFRACAKSFASGFSHVLPTTLPLLRVVEFQLLLNAQTSRLNPLQIEWERMISWVEWNDSSAVARVAGWLSRLVDRLVDEERIEFLLVLAQTFREARQVFFLSDSEDSESEGASVTPRVRIQLFRSGSVGDDVDGGSNELLPVVDATTMTLTMPKYSTYEKFESAMLQVLRGIPAVNSGCVG